MSSAEQERLQDVHGRLTALIKDWVGIVVGGEHGADVLTDILGSLQAMKELTRRIARTEVRMGRLERRKDQLRATLNTLAHGDANRVKERIDELQSQLDRLATKRAGLIENLSTLSSLLQGDQA